VKAEERSNLSSWINKKKLVFVRRVTSIEVNMKKAVSSEVFNVLWEIIGLKARRKKSVAKKWIFHRSAATTNCFFINSSLSHTAWRCVSLVNSCYCLALDILVSFSSTSKIEENFSLEKILAHILWQQKNSVKSEINDRALVLKAEQKKNIF
jgi:hypothetical protein